MPPSVAAQNTYVVLPPIDVKKERGSDNASAQRTSPKHGYYGKRPGGNIIVGNSDVLARRKEKREQLERHEKNKEAWYERNKEVIRECGIDMNRHKDSEMSDFYGRFRPGMKAMDDCEDEDDGDSGDRGGENSGDEDSEDGGDEDDEDRTDSGEDEDENGTDCNGDDDDLQSTGALTELPMNSPPKALSLPPLSAPPLSPGRKWLISESETEGIMTDMVSRCHSVINESLMWGIGQRTTVQLRLQFWQCHPRSVSIDAHLRRCPCLTYPYECAATSIGRLLSLRRTIFTADANKTTRTVANAS
jgi:hypothetical protein